MIKNTVQSSCCNQNSLEFHLKWIGDNLWRKMLKLLQRPGSFHIIFPKETNFCSQTWLWRIIVGIDIKTVYRDHGRFPPISPWLAGFRHINSQQLKKHVFFFWICNRYIRRCGEPTTTNNYFLVGDDYQPWLVTFSGRASQTFYMFYVVCFNIRQ